MGFWNALSILAPVTPAMSDAKDIRAARAQDEQDLAMKKLAAEGARQQNALAARDAQEQETVRQQLGIPLRHYKGADGADYTDYFTPSGVKAVADTPSNEDRLQNYFSSLKKLGISLTPEQQAEISPEFFGGRALTSKITQLSGDAGKPYKGSDGQWYVNEKDESGAIVGKPLGPNYQPPAPKPTSPSAQYANLLAKQILANKKQGPPLTNEEAAQLQGAQGALTIPGIARMKAMAEFAAQNHLQVVTGDDGQDILIPVAQAVSAANTGQPYGGPGIGAATGMDKKNQMLAESAIQQVNRMQAILRTDPNLTGPGAGQLTRLQVLLGSQDPDAQQFLISSLLASEHGVAVFGGRNIHTINDLNDALGSMKTNPAALSSALDVVKETMTPWLTANGRLTNPRSGSGNGKSGGKGSDSGKQHSLRTAMSLPFNKGKTAAQVKADLEAHGYTVTP
jgi:hypothetical protein